MPHTSKANNPVQIAFVLDRYLESSCVTKLLCYQSSNRNRMQYLQSITTSIMPRMSYVKKISTNDGATSPKNDAFASAVTDKDDAIHADTTNMAPGALLMTTDESNRSASA